MTRPIALSILLLAVIGCKKTTPPPAPAKVLVMEVATRDVPIYQQWIGTLDGYPNAQIRAQVTGYLIRQDYKEGGYIKKGDLLFEVDPRPFQAALDQARGKLAQDQAQLGLTEIDVKRYTPLAESHAISQEQLDTAVQANLGAKASIEADKAAVETAQLNLGFCRITSPNDGIAGVALAQIGDLVGPGTGALTTVSTVNPIRAYFNIPEQIYLSFFHQYTNAAALAAYQDKMELDLILSDGSTYPQKGTWLFTGRQVDLNTGTLQVAATFPNGDNILRPGQYALVRAKTEIRHNAVFIPQRAVSELQGAYQVVVVDAQNKAHPTPVVVGDQIGKDWLINSGLKAGDHIIVEGALKAKAGAVVDPQPYVAGEATNTATAKE